MEIFLQIAKQACIYRSRHKVPQYPTHLPPTHPVLLHANWLQHCKSSEEYFLSLKLASEDRGIVSEDRGIVSEDRGIVSENRKIVSEDRKIVSEDREMVSEDRKIVPEDPKIVSEE